MEASYFSGQKSAKAILSQQKSPPVGHKALGTIRLHQWVHTPMGTHTKGMRNEHRSPNRHLCS